MAIKVNQQALKVGAVAVVIAGLIFYTGDAYGKRHAPTPSPVVNKKATPPNWATAKHPWLYRGSVTDLKDKTITLQLNAHTSKALTFNDATKYTVNGKDQPVSSIKTGDKLIINGSTDEKGVMLASIIRPMPSPTATPTAAPKAK